MRSLAGFAVTLALAVLAAAGSASGREVRIPIRFDDRFLRELLVSTAFTDPEQTALVYTDGVDCKKVTLRNPRLASGGGAVTVTSDVETKLGTLFVGICLFRVDWSGKLESRLEPRLDPARPLVRFRVLGSKLREADGSEHAVTSAIWDWLEGSLARRLERLVIDLGAPLDDLRAVLPLFLTGDGAARAQVLVDSLRLESVAVLEREIELRVRLDAPPGPPRPAPRPEPELTPEELARFEAALSRWDGFVTYVVKRAGTETSDSSLRERLFEVLLEARQELVAAAAAPVGAEADPVRPLFLATWKRLSRVLRELGAQAGQTGVLRYLGFIAAADALEALDALGPDLGLEMTGDGLRRLARVLAPNDPADPLDAPEGVDPELRRALDFGDPLAPPELDEPESQPEPAPPLPQSGLEPLFRALRAFVFPTAHAAMQRPVAPARLTRDEERRMRGWAPRRHELNEYLPLVQRLLRGAAEDALASKQLTSTLRRTYFDLQLATAWQESCWRHYVRVKGQVIAIRSKAGAVGLMQVNSRVWRGFYDPRFVLRDPTYNARAGSEILLRYYADLAYAKGEHERDGGFDNLVRGAYAAYNGGPGHLARYRSAKTAKSLRAIDASFWKKYQAVRAGRQLEVIRCFTS